MEDSTTSNCIAKLGNLENHFKVFFDEIEDYIFIFDHTGKIINANKAAVIKLGYTLAELCSMNLFSIHPKQRHEEALELLKGTIKKCKIPLYSKDGLYIPVKTQLFHGEWGTKNVICSISKDLQEASTANDRFAKAFNYNPALMTISTIDTGELLDVNEAFLTILGFERNEVIGKKSSDLHVFVDKESRNLILEELRTESHPQDHEIMLRAKNGEVHIVLFSAHIIESKRKKYMLTIMNDITAYKKAQSEITIAKEQAEAATIAKSQFLANMSHEIRTPMNAIIGFSNLAAKTDLSAKQFDYVNKIERSAQSLLQIINDILDFSKIEAGKLEMETIDFQLDEVMNNIANMVSVKASEKNIELLIDIADNVPYGLIGDPLRLGQILLNICNNAVKFTETGTILLKVELSETYDKRSRIHFIIKDTGIGMTDEQINNLFVAFSQGDNSITRKFGGTGLGLTISKLLVEMMDGEIFVESQLGIGSTFAFTAEFTRQKNEEKRHQATPVDIVGLKVLIVDDNQLSREVLTEQLLSFRLDPNAVSSGAMALRELERAALDKPYDLVLMDWRMPGMDGIETAKMMRRSNKLGHIPLTIMVTAFDQENIVRQAENSGIKAFLLKPISPSLLFDTIMQVLGREVPASLRMTPLQKTFFNGKVEMKGTKVLLVEDVILNQQVATEILQSAGIIVEIANNGQEAVDAVSKVHYDAILMDIQMPVMGGYAATHLIRADKKNVSLPIIAMTAHAMQGAKEECLAAGMNDYISKPIDPEALFTTLGRWIQHRSHETTKTSIIQQAPTAKQQVEISFPTSLPGVDLQSGLQRLNENKKLYKDLLVAFAKDYTSTVGDIKVALEKNDFDTAKKLSHTLKGVAGNLSADDIYHAAKKLEFGISQKSTTQFNQLLTELDNVLQPLMKAVKRFDQL